MQTSLISSAFKCMKYVAEYISMLLGCPFHSSPTIVRIHAWCLMIIKAEEITKCSRFMYSHPKPICSLLPHSGFSINRTCCRRHKKSNLSLFSCFTLGEAHHSWPLQGTNNPNRSVIWAGAYDTIISQCEWGMVVGEMKRRQWGNNREVCGRHNGMTYWWNSSLRTLETCLMPIWQQILLRSISQCASGFPLSFIHSKPTFVSVRKISQG